MAEQQLPPGATPIDTDELLAAIGELYVQVRVLRRIVQQQQGAAATNGLAKQEQQYANRDTG
jgi:hypothetical protein